jgi:hypothetical protein
MNCARPEDSHGECRESGRCRGEQGKGVPRADESGVVPLVWSCHCMRLRLRYQWAMAVIMFSRAPVTATISGLPLAATFSLSRLQSRSESLNGVITPLRWSPTYQHTMDGDRLSMAVPLRGFTGFWDISDLRGFGYMIFTDSGVTWF